MFNKKILIVEDEFDIRESFEEYLSFMGFKNVLSAANPDEALEKIEQHKPDLILLDIQLKNPINGVEILKRTKEQLSPASKVIMVSGHREEFEETCYKLGAAAFWKKPILSSQIVEGIKKALSE